VAQEAIEFLDAQETNRNQLAFVLSPGLEFNIELIANGYRKIILYKSFFGQSQGCDRMTTFLSLSEK